MDLGILDLVIVPDSSLETWDREWWDPFSLLLHPPFSRDLTGSGWRSRLDEVELSENEAVLEGEMRLYWKINKVVLSGNEVVLGGKVRLHY